MRSDASAAKAKRYDRQLRIWGAHGLRGFGRWHAAFAERGRRGGCFSSREFHAGEWQGIFAEFVAQRVVLDYRTELRRQSEPGLRVRFGDEDDDEVQPERRRIVGTFRSGDRI